jgi:2-dehydro-3-deoxyphosphooctonate aldolase (KDO 8-P synthase)
VGVTPQFIEHLTKAGVAAGCNSVFIETHIEPRNAKCDAASMLKLDYLPHLLEQVKEIHPKR